MNETGRPTPEGADEFVAPTTGQELNQEINDGQRISLEQKRLYEALEKGYEDTPDIREHFIEQGKKNGTLREQFGWSAPSHLNREEHEYSSDGYGLEAIKAAIEETEMLYRHTFATNADTLIFLDKSARRYGELAHEVFPIMQLEYSRISNKPLEEIARPEILFINPVKGSALDVNEFSEKFGKHLAGKRVIVFDESTTNTSGYRRDPVGLKPRDQYDFYDLEAEEAPKIDYVEEDPPELVSDENWEKVFASQAAKNLEDRKRIYLLENKQKDNVYNGLVNLVAAKLSKALPETDIQTQVGLSGWKGGNLGSRIIPYVEIVRNQESGIFSTRKGEVPMASNMLVSPEASAQDESIPRGYLKMMAKAIFEDVARKSLPDLSQE